MYDDSWYIGGESLLEELFNLLKSKGYRIIAPVKERGYHVLEYVQEFNEVDLNYIRTINNPRHFLQPPNERILKWSYVNGKPIVNPEPVINANICFFGIHPCDANSIVILDKILLNPPEDTLYSIRRMNSFIIIHDCLKSDEYCFCEELGTRIPWDGSGDMWIVEKNDRYYVKAMSEKGRKILQELSLDKADTVPINEKYTIPNTIELFHKVNDEVWNDYSSKCLLCGSCLASCPTCVCFDIVDHISSLDPLAGTRIRTWNSCIFKSFTTVAGDVVFRSSKKDRFRFRYLHKFVIIPQWYSLPGCVGCGRCVMNCPLDIHPLDVLGGKK